MGIMLGSMELDFTQPPPQVNTLDEARGVIATLWKLCAECAEIPVLKIQIEMQQKQIAEQQKEIDTLKEKLNTNSNNSSNPPSSDRYKSGNKNQSTGKAKAGGQKGHAGKSRSFLSVNAVDNIEQHFPPEKCGCGGRVFTNKPHRRHQVHELPPITVIVTEHQLFDGCCESCGKKHLAQLPAGIPTGMLGSRLMALIATMGSDYKLSKRDIQRLLKDLYSLSIGVATVKRAEETIRAALNLPVEKAHNFVKAQAIVNTDETSHAECGRKKWTWVAIGAEVAVFLIAKNRNTIAAKNLLGESFSGILGSDRFTAYSWMPSARRQICWAHLKRDFQKIAEREDESKHIGEGLLAYTHQIFTCVHRVREGTLTPLAFKKEMLPIMRAIEAFLQKGAQIAHTKTQGTCRAILKLKTALWTFVENPCVEPTNNLAERVLRQIVIWRKICFGTWSENGSLYLERVMSVVATCRLQKRSVFGFLCDAIQAHLTGQMAPSLLPAS